MNEFLCERKEENKCDPSNSFFNYNNIIYHQPKEINPIS